MADIKDLRERLENMRRDLPVILSETAEIIATTAKAVAERTIKDKGFNEVYSSVKVPAWFLSGKELNAGGKQFIEHKMQMKEDTNWKELRDAQGLQTGHVDLSYSNEMWSGMFPQEASQHGDKYIARLGHTNDAGQKKMNWNRDRYGDFIGKTLTGDNFKLMADVAVEEITKRLKENE